MRPQLIVFPTRVGVDRAQYAAQALKQIAFSPHAWGWTADVATSWRHVASFPHTRGGGPEAGERWQGDDVFPTRVGVDRS